MSGSVIGASLAFWLGCLLKAGLADRLRRKPIAGSLIDAVRLEGWRIVFLCRLAPIAPSSVQSLIFGVSSVAYVPYILATAVGILPGVVLEVALGAGVSAGLRGDLSNLQAGLFGVGILMGFVALVLIIRRMRGVMVFKAICPGSAMEALRRSDRLRTEW